MEQSLHSAASSLLFLDSGDKIGSSFSVSSRSGGQKWRPQRFITSPCVATRRCAAAASSIVFINVREQKYSHIPTQTFASWCFCFNLQIFGTHIILHLSCMRLIQQLSMRKLKALLPKPAGSGELLIMWATWSQILQSADFIFHQPSPRTHRT